MKTTFSLEEVRQAFERLEEHAAGRGVDADCLWAIHAAADDVVRILFGEWEPGAPEVEDGPRARALGARTAVEFDRAALALLGHMPMADAAGIVTARMGLAMGWQPGPRSNAAMLKALEVYFEKRAAARSRGEAAWEAHLFARREGMRAYNEAIKG